MYFYAFNVGDYRSHTAHLSITEHYIYRSLIDWYYLNERPMPANDLDYIARVLMIKTDEDKQALQNVLNEFFKVKKLKLTGDNVECYHHSRIDAELKDYWHRNGGRVFGNTTEVTQGNVSGNVGNNTGNVLGNLSNATGNVTQSQKGNVLTPAQRTAKSKSDRKKIIADLQDIGATFDSNADIKSLREMHARFFGVTNADDKNVGNVSDVEIGNEILDTGNASGNVGNFESNVFANAITINQEPVTKKQNINNNTTREENFQPVDNSFDIRTWQAPAYNDFLPVLVDNEIYLTLSNADYYREVEKFKSYNANLASQGKSTLVDDSYRMGKFIDWFKLLAEKKQAKPVAGRFNIDDEDWSNPQKPVYDSPARHDTYHPSHAKLTTTKLDPSQSVMLNGVLKPCLPNMSQQQTTDYILSHHDAGESTDETYDRVARDFGALA